MALVVQADLEARLKRSLTAEEASAFTLINAALQATVERMIGSSVEAVNESTRYYDGGAQHCAIDPCTDITSIRLMDDSENIVGVYNTADYMAEPRNRTLKTMIRHRNTRGFVYGINNVAVTAKFSIYADSDMRNIVKDALLDALSGEIQNSDNVKRENIEGYSVEYASTETKSALSKISYFFPQV